MSKIFLGPIRNLCSVVDNMIWPPTLSLVLPEVSFSFFSPQSRVFAFVGSIGFSIVLHGLDLV